MKTKNYIAKNRTLKPAQDFDYLRKLGLEYIQKLGSKFWTDYNTHDPGITILEVLSYVVTELGYRTDFDIKNLLTSKSGVIENATFFQASEILTNAPLTEIDYRKLLIDIEGISNAWFLATKKQIDADGFYLPNDAETPVYVDPLDDTLSLFDKDRNGDLLQRLDLRGLNKVKIELENDLEHGNLNETIMDYDFWDDQNQRFVEVEVIPEFNSWSHTKTKLLGLMNKPAKIKNADVRIDKDVVKATYYRGSNSADSLHFTFKPYDSTEIEEVKKHFTLEKNSAALIDKLCNKKEKVENVFQEVHARLHNNRNIGEDYRCVETIDTIQIGVCLDVELASNSNTVETMALIQMAIDKVISPPIQFYTLSELVHQGLDATEIFVGPKLKNGFLINHELEKAQLPTCLHSSDIIAALMEIKDVVSVQNVQLSAYDNLGNPIQGNTSKKWCLDLSGDVKPVFKAEKSKILLFQKNIPFLLSESNLLEVQQRVELLKLQRRKNKLNNCKTDFDFPKGTFFQLNEYYSVQDEFPKNYHLGKNRLPENALPLKKSQVKQLKAYLHFYDQILADFFSQLYNAKDLLNIVDINQTYFPNYLKKNAKTGKEFYSLELYKSGLQHKLTVEKPSEVNTIFESTVTYFDRRNRALDHLMARFGESFNDYVFMMYDVNQNNSMNLINQKDLINDKQRFLSDYSKISSQRGIGMNYLEANSIANPNGLANNLWNALERSGYEKRVARLLGIDSLNYENIVTEDVTQPQTQWTVSLEPNSLVFKIIRPTINLNYKWNFAQKYFYDVDKYTIDSYGGSFIIYLIHTTKKDDIVKVTKIAKIDKKFISYEEAQTFLFETIQKLNIKYENFYCLEHILLRPFPISPMNSDVQDLLSVCLNDDCKDVANQDPYSFKATIVLPGYLFRFKNVKFRRYAEQIFRQEAPAHVLLKICWVNNLDMQNFQNAYKSWLENYGNFRTKYCKNTLSTADKSKFVTSHRLVLKTVKDLNTTYPEGNLYDCQTSELFNPILLGTTSLGTL
jgi:hypothetical protein